MSIILAIVCAVRPSIAYSLLSSPCKESLSDCQKQGELGFISIYGYISGEDLNVITRIDELLPRQTPFPMVYLNSAGGNLQAAFDIGRILRRRHATVVSGSPIFPAAASQCSSACVAIAAGATTRFITHIGIHQSSIEDEVSCNKFESRRVENWADENWNNYFLEMGIPSSFAAEKVDTTIASVNNILFDPQKPANDQKIVKYGFFQPEKMTSSIKIDSKPSVSYFHSVEKFESNAALYGSKAAAWDLVDFLADPELGQKGLQEAFFLLKTLANDGDSRAIFLVGNYYMNGYGVDRDVELGRKYYRQAAELGVAEAEYIIGRDALAEGMETDAAYWLGAAGDKKHPAAIMALCDMFINGRMFLVSKVSGIKWCKVANQVDTDPTRVQMRERKIDAISATLTAADNQMTSDLSINMRADSATFSKCVPGMETR